MRTPPVLFTFDKCFRTDSLTTPRRRAAHERFQKYLAELNLSPSQVVVLTGNKMYVRESPDLVEIFFSRYDIAPGSIIFSDNGRSFFRNKQPLIPQICQATTSTYPAIVHQFLSPNDNHHHGAAKAKWRAMYGKWDGVLLMVLRVICTCFIA